MYQIFKKQTLVFRTQIIRQCNPVRVHKLTESVTGLCLAICIRGQVNVSWCNKGPDMF